jgi:hypothetical protein
MVQFFFMCTIFLVYLLTQMWNVYINLARYWEWFFLFLVLAHNIVHFSGKPQGPSLSFSAFGTPASCFPLPVAVGAAAVSSFFTTSAFFPLLSEPASQAKDTLLIAVPKLSP